jgi:hypothetical protein
MNSGAFVATIPLIRRSVGKPGAILAGLGKSGGWAPRLSRRNSGTARDRNNAPAANPCSHWLEPWFPTVEVQKLLRFQGGLTDTLSAIAFVFEPFTPTRYRAQTHWYRPTTCTSLIWMLGRANRTSARSEWSPFRSASAELEPATVGWCRNSYGKR